MANRQNLEERPSPVVVALQGHRTPYLRIFEDCYQTPNKRLERYDSLICGWERCTFLCSEGVNLKTVRKFLLELTPACPFGFLFIFLAGYTCRTTSTSSLGLTSTSTVQDNVKEGVHGFPGRIRFLQPTFFLILCCPGIALVGVEPTRVQKGYCL